MQEFFVLEEIKMSPYFLSRVISRSSGIIAHRTLEFGSGLEIKIYVHSFFIRIKIYLRKYPGIVYVRCFSEKIFVNRLCSSLHDGSVVDMMY